MQRKKKMNNTISFKLLSGLLITFLAGYFANNLIANANSISIYSFSTPDLINFILSVLLSGASIVLAISAISLGKFSEQAMIQRSDESIRLQNEVFQKTTDALQRIESSTGVTEKRLEDIISGRVGDLSQKIARIATESKKSDGSLQPEEIEDLIRKTLLQSFGNYGVFPSRHSLQETEALVASQKQKQEDREKYHGYHDKLEAAITQRSDLRALKLGQGTPSESGLKLFDDVIINKNGKKIGIIDFPSHMEPSFVRQATENALKELQLNIPIVDFVQILIYESNTALESVYKEIVSIVDPVLKSKISFSVCPTDQIDKLVETFSI
jgi:hypothetical protein